MMKNYHDKVLYCRRALINSFVHPLIANLFTNWNQVNNYLMYGQKFEQALADNPEALNAFNLLKGQIHPPGIIDLLDNSI